MAMAMTRAAACTGPSLIYTSFSSTREETCSTSSPSVCAALSGPRSSRVRRAATLACPRIRIARNGIPQLLGAGGLRAAASWEGCLHLGRFLIAKGKGKEVKRTGGQGVQASLLGVGAPEALVIGVVALLVFGPKGLAEVARTLGKSLRAFQPTIRELQQVSREFKNTLEQEIGLDELRNPSTFDPPPTSSPSSFTQPPAPPAKQDVAVEPKPVEPKAYSTEDYMRITEEQAKALVPEEQRKAAEAAAWGGTPPGKPVAEKPSEEVALEKTTAANGASVEKPSIGEQENVKEGDSVEKASESPNTKT